MTAGGGWEQPHDGIARAVLPANTDHDGDAAYALAAGTREAPFDLVAVRAVACVSEAIRNAVRHAAPAAGLPGLGRPQPP